MNHPFQIAQHFRQVHFGGNWTSVNLKETLQDVDWQMAITKTGSFNTILALTYHIHYYVHVVLNVLKGGPLEASDQFSFDHPVLHSQQEWESLLEKVWSEAESFASLVGQLPESKLNEDMADPKYGTWHRNLLGIIEHCHYHLGQIVLIKKLLSENRKP